VTARVLLTGASSGIGAATATALRARGCRVTGLDLRPADGVLLCDVRDQAQVDAAVSAAIGAMGGLDVLINCAGVGDVQGAGDPPGADALALLDVNLFGAWRVTAAALPSLRDTRGRVVNVASGLAFLTLPLAAAYCASKRALVAYSDALRLEHGDVITVTTVYPGYIRTPIHARPAAKGVSLEGLVPAERIDDAVATLLRAALGRPRRDLATTRRGALAYAALRALPPSWVDRAVTAMTRGVRSRLPGSATRAA
jgi:NAD(P)-dependent dehydrogenase (short-subunit alcohol dehydrogenase family)